MRVIYHIYFLSLYCLFLIFFSGCTDNPFISDKNISSRTIRGKVYLKDGSKPEGIFVWLEGLDVGTRTDENGDFLLSLPPPMSEGTKSGVNGNFYLYFYMANYRLDSSEVVIVNGEVSRSQGDINENGELRNSRYLSKILDIETKVSPQSIPIDYGKQLLVTITLRALSSPVIVESLKKVESKVLKRSGLIILDKQGNFLRAIGTDASWKKGTEIINLQPEIWEIEYSWIPCDLPIGTYTIVPYLLVKQENVLPELIDNLGMNVEELGHNFLTIPFKRKGGDFMIINP